MICTLFENLSFFLIELTRIVWTSESFTINKNSILTAKKKAYWVWVYILLLLIVTVVNGESNGIIRDVLTQNSTGWGCYTYSSFVVWWNNSNELRFRLKLLLLVSQTGRRIIAHGIGARSHTWESKSNSWKQQHYFIVSVMQQVEA